MIGRIERAVIGVAAALISAATFACGKDYLHTNPYDNAFPVTITLSGPDTLFSYREQGVFTAKSDPAFPDSSFWFSSSDSIAFFPAGPGGFSAASTPLYPATRTVQVLVGLGAYDTIPPGAGGALGPGLVDKQWRHTATKNVVLTQKVVNIALRCPDTHSCAPVAVGGTLAVWVDGTDAIGHQIVALTSSVANPASGTPVATFVVRDPSVASFVPTGIRVATVTALKSGTTWIVATRGALLDSLKLTVQ